MEVNEEVDMQILRLRSQGSIQNPASVKMRNGVRYNLLVKIAKSSVNYFILSFLPPLQIIRMGQLN